MRNAQKNPTSIRLAKAALAVFTVALLGLASAPQAQASDNDNPSKEQKTVIDITGSQQFNPCVNENVTITRGKDTIRTRTQDRNNGGVRIETRDQSEGEGVGDVSFLKYHYDELFETRNESSETTFTLRLEHRKHLIRQKDNPRNDDYFERTRTRLEVVNGVTKASEDRIRIECK